MPSSNAIQPLSCCIPLPLAFVDLYRCLTQLDVSSYANNHQDALEQRESLYTAFSPFHCPSSSKNLGEHSHIDFHTSGKSHLLPMICTLQPQPRGYPCYHYLMHGLLENHSICRLPLLLFIHDHRLPLVLFEYG